MRAKRCRGAFHGCGHGWLIPLRLSKFARGDAHRLLCGEFESKRDWCDGSRGNGRELRMTVQVQELSSQLSTPTHSKGSWNTDTVCSQRGEGFDCQTLRPDAWNYVAQ